MSRDQGFDVMDVSTAIIHDPKVRKLARFAPDHAGVAFTAYMAVMAESWKAGRRVPLDDAWPPFLPYDQSAAEALAHVGLLDSKGLIPLKAWHGWFDPASERRDRSRDRWARYNAKRDPSTASVPRGSDAVTASDSRGDDAATATSVRPSVPTDRPSARDSESPRPPTRRGGRRADATNPRAVAAAERRAEEQVEADRRSRRSFRRRAYLDGRLTEAQRREMDGRDAPLDEIPAESGAAYALVDVKRFAPEIAR